MNYASRPRPWARISAWRLDGPVLIHEGGKAYPIARLRVFRVGRGEGRYAPNALTLRLVFQDGAANFSGLSFDDRFSAADRSAELAAFARAVLREGAVAAPRARYETGRALVPGIMLGAAAILSLGVGVVLLAAVAAGSWPLGLEFAARLSFPLALLAAAWPWVSGIGLTRFDPSDPPAGLGL